MYKALLEEPTPGYVALVKMCRAISNSMKELTERRYLFVLLWPSVSCQERLEMGDDVREHLVRPLH